MTDLLDDDEEFTELHSAQFGRVDLVGSPANGSTSFLVMKQDSSTGLLEPGFVRDLIAKAEPAPSGRERAVMPSGVTLSGSAADIAAFIHKAAQRTPEPAEVAKADLSGKSKDDLPDSAFAFIESGGKKDDEGKTTPRSLRHFPIHDKAHADNAAARIAQGAKFGDKAKGKVEAAQRKFGEKVSKEAGVPDTVAKDMGPELDDGIDQMDPTVPLAEPDEMGPGDMTDPGSPAWESVDAATAQKWTSIAVRLKNALSVMADREFQEAAGADPDDAENAFNLEDAMCAVDFVISTLAVFAAGEQAEADLGGEAMDAIGKSAAPDLAAVAKAMGTEGLPGALSVIETFGAVRKAGRVLSSVNEAHIREAHEKLNTVLSSLPQAPVTDDGQPVAKSKEAAVTATATATEPVAKAGEDVQAAASDPVNAGGTTGMGTPKGGEVKPLPGDMPGREVMKSALALVYDQDHRLVGVTDAAAIVQQVAKADGEKAPMQAVFDQNGDLIGIVAPDAIQPVTGAGKPAAADPDPAADAAPAADPADMTPAPPAETGTPAGAVDDGGTVAKSTQETITLPHDVLKGILAEAVTAALGAQAPAQDIAKSADVAGIRAQVESLLADVEVLKEQPAAPKVFTNGQVPPANQLRGQDQGAGQAVDVAKEMDRRKRLYGAPDAAEQNKIAAEMMTDARTTLQGIHQGRPS